MNVLVVEDELHTSKLLKEIIEQDESFIVTACVESIAEAVQYLNKHQQKLDLMFLDIELADGHSFEIFRNLDVKIPVVFCTAYDEFTLQAIKNNGIDYILKPFKDEDIHTALGKFKTFSNAFRSKELLPVQFPPTTEYQQCFLTQYRDKTLVKYVKDIALFRIENETVYLHTFSGEKFPVFKNLEYLESVCDPKQFFRINRQMLVNKNAVVSLQPYFHRKMMVELSVELTEKPLVSKTKVSKFLSWLES